MKALIVAGGSIERDFALSLIEKEEYELKIAADSGMNFYYQNKIMPDLIVGDFDSANQEVLTYYYGKKEIEIEKLNPIKDDTDTEHAIRSAIKYGADQITILGATGTRLDHVLGNISLLGIGLEEYKEIFLIDPYNRIRLINHSICIRKEEQFGRYVSLLPYAGDVTGVTLKGMKYLLEHYTLGGFNSLGISNEILNDTAEILMESGYMLVIESRDSWE